MGQGYALKGNAAVSGERLDAARSICDQLPDRSSGRLGTESGALTASKVAQAAAYCHVRLANYTDAERQGRECLAVDAWSPGSAGTTRLDLAVALTHLGSPDEAVQHGHQALSEPRFSAASSPGHANSTPS